MFSEDFNPDHTLATVVRPRCHSVGLAVPDAEAYANIQEADHHIKTMNICPSIVAWCPAFRL